VPLLAACGERRWLPAIATLFVASWSWSVIESDPNSVAHVTARLLACFTAGMLLYLLRDGVPFRLDLAAAAAALLSLAALGGVSPAAFPVAGGYLLVCTGCSRSLPLHRFGRFGDFSYGLFLFGFPIQQSIVHFMGRHFSLWLFFGLAFAVTLACAI